MANQRRCRCGEAQCLTTAHRTSGSGHSHPDASQPSKSGQTPSSDSAQQQQSTHANGKKSKHDSAASQGIRGAKKNTTRKTRCHARSHGPETFALVRQRYDCEFEDGALAIAPGDTDYQGHRVRAMNHIASAIRHLGSPMGMGYASDYSGGGNLPQAQSNQILRDAIFRLSQTQASLGPGMTAAAHHHHAHASITEAIRELEVALRIR